jgi:hypothetical protein
VARSTSLTAAGRYRTRRGRSAPVPGRTRSVPSAIQYILPGAGVLFLLWGLAQRFGSGPYPTIGDLPIFFGLIDLMILPLVALVVLVRVPGLHARTGRQDFAFSPRGVQIRSQRAESNVAWSAYRSSAEGGRFFVLRPLNSRARVFIPKRAFASPEDLPRFRQLLALHAAGQLR